MLLAAGDFVAPGPEAFDYPEIIFGVTKPILQVILAVLLIGGFLVIMSGRLKLVPGRLQTAVELLYEFVRNSIGGDMIGKKEVRPYIPLLLSLFTFILLNNLFGFIPFFQLPSMSHIAFPIVLAILSLLVFNIAGIRRHGFFGYFRNMMFPPGVPVPVYILLAPIEFVSTMVFRPVTLALRLFATMFAGHLVLLVFVKGGEFLLLDGQGLVKVAAPVAFVLALFMAFVEILIQVLQAYIFTVLTAIYVGGAIAEEH